MTKNYRDYVPENPEERFAILPVDPFDERQIQFEILEKMGYPVTLLPSTIEDAYKDEEDSRNLQRNLGNANVNRYGNESLEAQHMAVYAAASQLVRPLILVADFGPYVEGLSVLHTDPVGLLDISQKQREVLMNHPAPILVENVSKGDPAAIGIYMDTISLQPRLPHTPVYLPEIVMPVAESSYVRAMDRYQDNITPRDNPTSFQHIQSRTRISQSDIDRYDILIQRGVTPVEPLLLTNLVQNYYEIVGNILPDFARFRKER